MKAIRLTLIFALAAALLAPVVGAQDDAGSEGTVIELETHADGNTWYFTKVGDDTKNPPLTVQAGETVTLRFTNKDGNYHNIDTDIEGVEASPGVQKVNETAEITFTAPAEGGEFKYFCVPHQFSGMEGALIVEGGSTGGDETGPDASANNTPGVSAVVAMFALAGLAALVGRRE